MSLTFLTNQLYYLHQPQSTGEKMDAYKKLEIMKSRYDRFTEHERAYYHRSMYYYDRYFIDNKEEDMSDYIIDSCWVHSRLGAEWTRFLGTANLLLEKRHNMEKIFEKVQTRRSSYGRRIEELRIKNEQGILTAPIINIWLMRIDKTLSNIVESYVHDPIFNVGQITQMRANIGVDAIIHEQKYSNGNKHYQSVGRSTLKKLKDKTFVVIQVDPPLNHRVWASSYSYKEKQGGGRYYKLLPLGETKTYYVVEKFMKKCRTKAVKDAKR